MPIRRPIHFALLAIGLAACERTSIVQPEQRSAGTLAVRDLQGSKPSITVADVEQLYTAVNDPARAGFVILIAPGTYSLSTKTPGNVTRPNGGRLELQPDMSLIGVAGDRSAVVIDMSALPLASFNTSSAPSSTFW